MLASYDDAEDAVQEAFLRPRGVPAARSTGEHPRAWLYRIATSVCLDRGRERRARSGAEVSRLTPYPDTVLDDVPAVADQPDQAYVARETVVASKPCREKPTHLRARSVPPTA
jgi:DNA-directed RNA polymerase specialized sigma24 family protein